jgi:hypothetical protein
MNRDQVAYFESWFKGYVSAYYSQGQDHKKDWAIQLKEDHSLRVRQEIVRISHGLDLPEKDILVAEVLGLFHDIGRFSQYQRYATFRDDISENHAELGIKELSEAHILDDLPKEEKELIRKGILYHNLRKLPQDEDPRGLFFCKLIRDADKLDIWRVIIDYYYRGQSHISKSVLQLGLADTPGYSNKILNDLCSGQTPESSAIENLNDFKLLQIGWVYDINFHPTFQEIEKRNYLEKIGSTLQETKEIKEVLRIVENYLAVQAT